MGSRWWWVVVACLTAVLALGVAHLVYEPDHIDPADYRAWRAYCTAEADRAYVHGTRSWADEVNECLVDVATADQ
jgi:hypothetical protein